MTGSGRPPIETSPRPDVPGSTTASRASSGAWTPVLWPLRGVIPLTAFMLFLQGISELMKSLWAWRTGAFLARHEKIEV